MSTDDLGDRMKRAEAVTDLRLMRRVPVIIRVDGKAFHTLSRKLDKPFDSRMQSSMWAAALALCQGLQGARCAYTQSDEISVLLIDYDQLTTDSAFDYRLQKLCSISAAIATAAFTRVWSSHFPDTEIVPLFDSRVFNMDRADVGNYFFWRQLDATRNSISGLAQAHFSAKQLHGKDSTVKQQMLRDIGQDWNAISTHNKRGVCVVKQYYDGPNQSKRSRWAIDPDIPVFSQDRNYIGQYVIGEMERDKGLTESA